MCAFWRSVVSKVSSMAVLAVRMSRGTMQGPDGRRALTAGGWRWVGVHRGACDVLHAAPLLLHGIAALLHIIFAAVPRVASRLSFQTPSDARGCWHSLPMQPLWHVPHLLLRHGRAIWAVPLQFLIPRFSASSPL